ncbi:Inner nuclear membrane protein SRC1 [Cytospora mali]|uniref:Inner nuclear membrane protein SRC1 n=1 Tax=Cytospora mali TaxID=578113 RepID=A0A194VGN0_CYTMA|nr:Inner nuclear membrane protein SRC1 [Valsa mali var. pyri (nom. inval.)]
MSDTEVDYLQPDFVPSSVTMPRLRSILVSQNVPYPATAKKAQLVEIFNDNVAPRARKLLAQRQKAKRSSMGITNIDGSQGYSVTNDDLRAPPSARRSRSPRKPTRSFKQESQDPEHIPEHVTLSPRKRQARSAGRQLAPSDTDTESYYESTRSPRKPSRGAELTPKPERRRAESEEDGDVYQRRSNEPDTVFTSDNPFQSRTPSMPMTTPLNRRRTAGLESTIRRNASSSLRRRAERPQDDDYDSTVYSERFETPASMFTRPVTPRTPRSPQPLTVEAGEEFTPDEQLAMNQEDAERAQQAMVPVRQNKRSTSLSTPLWVFFVTLFGAYAAWYRQEKLAVGYCGVGRPEHDIIPRQLEFKDYKFDVPEWAFQLVEPQCEPCPPHAYCYVDGSVRCEDAFILKPHPLSAGGLVPLPPTCEPDGEKVRRVKAVADKAIEELRERQAKFECGELIDEDGHQSQTPMIAVDELKETVSDKRSKKLNKKEFDDLWAAALGEIETRDEIMIEHKDDSESSLARLPLRCALRRSVRLSLERNRLSIISVVLFIISALYGRSRYRSYRAMSAQVPALVDLVLGRLATQKELAYEEGGEDDPFLFLPNLRDDVLRSVFSLSERERIWQRVKAVVEQNTNVRTGQREGNNGEVGRAWEWIGPSGALENGARRRKIGRGVSWGADVKELEEDNKSAIHKQWEEPGSRPMY